MPAFQDRGRFNAVIVNPDEFSNLDPSAFNIHDKSKLRAMWKGLNKRYEEARIKYQILGTHDADFKAAIARSAVDREVEDFQQFIDFPAVYYLRKVLETKPGLNNFVIDTLSNDIQIDTSVRVANSRKVICL